MLRELAAGSEKQGSKAERMDFGQTAERLPSHPKFGIHEDGRGTSWPLCSDGKSIKSDLESLEICGSRAIRRLW